MGVGVGVGVGVLVGVGVGVAVLVAVGVDVGVGVGASTRKVTLTVRGVSAVQGKVDMILIVPVYSPAARSVISTDTFIVVGAVPEEGLKLSQV